MGMKEAVRQHMIRVLNEVTKWSRNAKIAAVSGAVACIVLIAVLIATAGTEVYSLEIAGRDVGYITDKNMVDQALEALTAEYADGKKPLELSVDREAIKYKATDFEKKEITALTEKELEDKIIASGIFKANGWAININGKDIVAASSEEGANQILDGVKNHYLSNGSKLISADFKENVLVTQAAVGLSDIMEPDDAVSYLITGKIDQQLNLVATVPYVTVETKEMISSAEKIDFNTVYEETGSLLKGQTKVKTPGASGTRAVSSEVTKENGVITGTTVVSSVVTVEPKDQITLKGTKEAPSLVVSSRGSSRTVSISASGSDVVAYAKTFLGVPYKSGGSTPSGFDCSGFTQYVMKYFGGNLPRTTTAQYDSGVKISKSELRAGDLVFFKPSASSSRISHVGIYIGGGQFIDSPQPGENVMIHDLSSSYNVSHYYGAVRVLN